MKIAVFNAKRYDRNYFTAANHDYHHELVFIDTALNETTAKVGSEYPCVCAFVNDRLSKETIHKLAEGETKLIAMRCAGYNNVDLEAAKVHGITVVRVPAYSPHAVAEHVFALLLALYRKTHRAYNRVRDRNFSLEGMVGIEIKGKSVGVVGTGTIGHVVARLFLAFGCDVIAHDVVERDDLKHHGVRYVQREELFRLSDIITLHCPLLENTRHLINADSIQHLKKGMTLINTSRGALLDTEAVYQALKSRKIGYLGIDVYEEEEKLFFEDFSSEIVEDDLFMRLTTFPNVIITGHQAFFTENALGKISDTTLNNVREFEESGQCRNAVSLQP